MTRGKLFVISAPSGAGKTTLLRRVMAEVAGLTFSISHTTRKPRIGERDGVDYYFVSREQFLAMIEDNMFLEHAEVHDNLYGTSADAVDLQLQLGLDVILDIDVQGAEILRTHRQPGAIFIFIAPPGLNELEARLRGRGTENEETIGIRMKNAQVEMQAAVKYDYLIINDTLEEAEKVLTGIILAERAKSHRLPSGKAMGELIF